MLSPTRASPILTMKELLSPLPNGMSTHRPPPSTPAKMRETGHGPPDCNVPCVEDIWSKLQAVRQEWGPKLGPHLMLDILATDPGHMRRGAGKMLMRLGTDIADEMGL